MRSSKVWQLVKTCHFELALVKVGELMVPLGVEILAYRFQLRGSRTVESRGGEYHVPVEGNSRPCGGDTHFEDVPRGGPVDTCAYVLPHPTSIWLGMDSNNSRTCDDPSDSPYVPGVH